MVEMRIFTDEQCLDMATKFLDARQDKSFDIPALDGVAEELARGLKLGVKQNLISYRASRRVLCRVKNLLLDLIYIGCRRMMKGPS